MSYGGGDSGNVNLDRISLSACTACPVKVEAETSALSGGTGRNADHIGYSGAGVVDKFEQVGATTTFVVSAPRVGTVPLTLRYANANGSPRTLTQIVNGVARHIVLPSWADWDTWSDHVSQVPLTAGNNVISYSYSPGDTGHVNLDYLTVGP